MDASVFLETVKQDPQISTFLQEVAVDCENLKLDEEPSPDRYFTLTGVDLIIALTAFALYRWLKDYFDKRRALNETEIVKARARIVAGLIEDGFKPGQAEEVTAALFRQLKKRNQDDPILISAARFLEK